MKLMVLLKPFWQRRKALLVTVAFEGALGLLSFPLGWLLGQPPLQTWRWSLWDLALGAAASLPMLVLGLALAHWPTGPLVPIRKFIDEVVRPFFHQATLFDFFLISLVAGLGEEMLIRGVIQSALGNWLGPWPALVLASALFGLLHPITLTYLVLAMLGGAYLGLVWMMADNLLAVVVSHSLYDFIMLVYLLREAKN
jgi:membrane protease YdiL (CAAX protease family)